MEQDTQVVIDVSVDNVQDVVETSNERLVILSFYSGHMPESQKMNQLFAQLMPRYQEQITLAQVDCDTQPQMAQYFQIQSLPTVMLLQKVKRSMDSLVIKQNKKLKVYCKSIYLKCGKLSGRVLKKK